MKIVKNIKIFTRIQIPFPVAEKRFQNWIRNPVTELALWSDFLNCPIPTSQTNGDWILQMGNLQARSLALPIAWILSSHKHSGISLQLFSKFLSIIFLLSFSLSSTFPSSPPFPIGGIFFPYSCETHFFTGLRITTGSNYNTN